jgi:hypothetical protein
MKQKNIVNKDTSEVMKSEFMKRLLNGLDYNTSYIVEFMSDGSVNVSELGVVEDRFDKLVMLKTDKTLYYKKND